MSVQTALQTTVATIVLVLGKARNLSTSVLKLFALLLRPFLGSGVDFEDMVLQLTNSSVLLKMFFFRWYYTYPVEIRSIQVTR